MFARALANTCNVPVIYGSASRWQEAGSLDSHLKAMRESFEEAVAQAPAILFVDEVDSFGDRMARDHNSSYDSKAIAGFLELLDGFDRREGVVVVAACNHPNALDPAIKRAGRLDRHFVVALPDRGARLSILKFHSGIEFDSDARERFSLATEGISGADIEQIVRDAKRIARHRGEHLRANHILEKLQPLMELPGDFIRRLAAHEVGHAIVSVETGHGVIRDVKISSARIDGRRSELGYVEFEQSVSMPHDRAAYLNRIAMLLGGMAAELEVFGDFSDGSSGDESADLNLATELATCFEGSRGMGSTLIVEGENLQRLRHLRLSNSEFRARVSAILESELERARAIVRSHRSAFDIIVDQLIERKSVSGEEVGSIINRHKLATVSLAKTPFSNEDAAQ
jgi:ATP-dependent Zn protease